MAHVTDESGILTERELKLTAALYASLGAHRFMRKNGQLPQAIGDDCHWLPVQRIVASRGVDFVLTKDEQYIYDAFVRAGRVPGAAVRVEAA